MNNAAYQPYPAYAESGVEWLGERPAEWNVLPFFVRASQCRRSNKGMVNDNLLSLSYGRIVRKSIEASDGLLPASFETYQIVEPWDVVFRLTDLQNDKHSLRSALCQERGIITSAYLAARPVGIEPSYLAYLMRSYDLSKVLYAMGSGLRQSLKYSDIRRLPLLVPSDEEQAQIAKFLDHETAKIDALIEKQQQLIALLKEKRQAVISHAVTKGLNPDAPMRDSGVKWLGEVPAHWEVSRFGYVSSVVRGGSPRPAGDPTLFDGDYSPWVTVAEITSNDEIALTRTATSLTKKGSMQCRVFKAGTLLLSNSGATLGVPKVLMIDANANDGVVGFQDLKHQREYCYHYLSSLTEDLRERVKQGSGQPNLNTAIVKALTVPIPPADEIQAILRHIDEQRNNLNRLASKCELVVELLKERRTALISAAVTGKIDVRDWKPPQHEAEADAA